MQRTAVAAGAQFGIRERGLIEQVCLVDGDETVQHVAGLSLPGEELLGQRPRGEIVRPQCRRDLVDRAHQVGSVESGDVLSSPAPIRVSSDASMSIRSL